MEEPASHLPVRKGPGGTPAVTKSNKPQSLTWKFPEIQGLGFRVVISVIDKP